MCLTFQMLTLGKYFTKIFEIFYRGYPHFGPSRCGVSKNDHPSITYDPTFYCRNLFHSKNLDVCKKQELNPLRFDQDIRVLSSKKIFSKFFIFSPCERKNSVNQRVFKILLKFFFYMVNNYPLIL